MKELQAIKERLKTIQKNFNPQKNTYKVIEYVVNNKLTYKQMLAELSKIKGFDKYPDALKKEYVSIIKEIKKNIIKQMKEEERERQEANTKELKDIIANLEKSKKEYMEKEEVKEKPKTEEKKELPQETKKEKQELKQEMEQEKSKTEAEDTPSETDEEKIAKIKKVLVVGIFIVLILIAVVLFIY